MFIVRYRKIFYIFSGLSVIAAILILGIWGLRPGIDFTGGSILEVEYKGVRPDTADLKKYAETVGLGHAIFQPAGEKRLLVRLGDISEDQHQILLSVLAGGADVKDTLDELRFDSIGPTIGKELRRNAFIAIFLVLIMILAFVTFSFRKVSEPVSSWKYGLVAIIALIHDVIVPSGAFALLGHFRNIEVDTLFVSAILTILAFSVYDTIVVFDRIRENIKRSTRNASFEEVVGKSLSEVMGRSVATSFILFLVLLSLYIFGESSTTYFSLTLLIGLVAGTYSSVCLASPMIVTWNNISSRRRS